MFALPIEERLDVRAFVTARLAVDDPFHVILPAKEPVDYVGARLPVCASAQAVLIVKAPRQRAYGEAKKCRSA